VSGSLCCSFGSFRYISPSLLFWFISIHFSASGCSDHF
jgi:hypothetical protein